MARQRLNLAASHFLALARELEETEIESTSFAAPAPDWRAVRQWLPSTGTTTQPFTFAAAQPHDLEDTFCLSPSVDSQQGGEEAVEVEEAIGFRTVEAVNEPELPAPHPANHPREQHPSSYLLSDSRSRAPPSRHSAMGGEGLAASDDADDPHSEMLHQLPVAPPASLPPQPFPSDYSFVPPPLPSYDSFLPEPRPSSAHPSAHPARTLAQPSSARQSVEYSSSAVAHSPHNNIFYSTPPLISTSSRAADPLAPSLTSTVLAGASVLLPVAGVEETDHAARVRLRNSLAMELLWTRQAIESRKQFLRIVRDMDLA